MKHLHTLTRCDSLLYGASLAVPALALPTGRITSHFYSIETQNYTNYVYMNVGTSVDNSLSNTTAYVEVADRMSLTAPGATQGTQVWDYDTDPKHYTVAPHIQQASISRFGYFYAVREYSYLSETYLSVSDAAPYTGGTATVLQTDNTPFIPSSNVGNPT